MTNQQVINIIWAVVLACLVGVWWLSNDPQDNYDYKKELHVKDSIIASNQFYIDSLMVANIFLDTRYDSLETEIGKVDTLIIDNRKDHEERIQHIDTSGVSYFHWYRANRLGKH